MSDSGVVIERRVTIYSKHAQKKAWTTVPELIEGREFITVLASDGGFSRFVSGKVKGCAHMSWLNELKRLRTEASIKSGVADDDTSFQQGASSSELKANKKNAEIKQQMGALPKCVTVQLPDIEHDGVIHKGIDMVCASCIEWRSPVKVELNPAVLEYVKIAMLSSDSKDKRARSSEAKMVYWRPDRKRYIARRSSPEHVLYKSFKPQASDATSMDECRELAERWANGEDVSSASGDGSSDEGKDEGKSD